MAIPNKPDHAKRKRSLSEGLPRAFGRLTLLKPIARGGMGEVYLATSGGIEGAERPCVVKIIRREHAEDKSFLARFFDEARIQAQLDHPGVARVLEAATDPSGKPFVVVEYIEGRNLAELRNRGSQLNARIAWPEAVAIGVAVTEALSHVHERTDADGRPLEIVHRDLSPQNVMVGYGGDTKLIDFGTARGENRRCHTVSGVVLAKPGYVAPEVANDTPGGVPADIYAVGIIIWELIAGRRFLTGDPSAHVSAVAAGKRNPAPIAELVKAPPELDTVIARMTAPRIEDRYGSARDAMADLIRLMKKAPSLANGQRGVRARIAHVMDRLYPAEPARSRAELARLTAEARHSEAKPESKAPSPSPAPAEADDSLFPGTRYRVVREIGKGAMATVYEAHHVDIGRTVALKVLPKERCGSADLEARFRSEARAIARLRHDGLVTLYDFGIAADGRPYYAMELLEGESLERFLDRERVMGWREALEVGVEVCTALESAHLAGLVHRDIKPANLFRTTSGRVKVLDFGVAQAAEDVHKVESQDVLRLLGTVEYMAPEQATGERVDERADIYALGAVLYELVTGRLPHVAPTGIALIDKKIHEAIEKPSERARQLKLPRAVDRVVMRALETAPPKRYKNVVEMRQALLGALSAPARARARRRSVAIAAMALTAAAVSGAALVRATDADVRARAIAMASPLIEKLRAPTSPKGTSAAQPEQADEPVAILHEAPAPKETPASTPEKKRPATSTAPKAAPEEPALDDAPDHAESRPEPDPLPPELEQKLAEADDLGRRGKNILSLNAYRKLVKKHPEEPRVLEGWSKAAIGTKGWGEALRAAIKWASLDSRPRAQLHLATTQRAVGQRYGAVETLIRLLDRHPQNEEAQALLEQYAPGRLAQR